MAKHDEYFIEKRDDRWVIFKPHAERISDWAKTYAEALARAKQLAPEGVIHVKALNGKFRKVQG